MTSNTVSIVAGIDIGSTTTKVVIRNGKKIYTYIGPTGPEYRALAHEVLLATLAKGHLSVEDLDCVVATGYGRLSVPFADQQITEISCHARGVFSIFPSARTVIDIGGQDSKAIRLDENGKVVDFVMNDKCAAGTGRFLEVVADSLGLPVAEIGPLSEQGHAGIQISSICTVFAEQEVTSYIADGKPVPDILRGLHESLATRVYSMAQRIKIQNDVVLTGGVAKNSGLRSEIEKKVGLPVRLPPEPLLTGAIGATLFAEDLLQKAIDRGEHINKDRHKVNMTKIFEG